MPTEQEYINYKDFVESLDEATPSANDKAVFNDANGPKVSLYSSIANFVLNLWATFVSALTAKTSFASGDKIPVVNGGTATAMEADKLLELTAQNTLAGNVAPEFDESGSTTYTKYERVMRGGQLYQFNKNHSGAWNSSDVNRVNESTDLFTGGVHLSAIDNLTTVGIYRKTGDTPGIILVSVNNNRIHQTVFSSKSGTSGYIQVRSKAVSDESWGSWVEMPIKNFGDVAKNFAPTFIPSTNYKKYDKVVNNGVTYIFNQDHPAGAWNSSHVNEYKFSTGLFTSDVAYPGSGTTFDSLTQVGVYKKIGDTPGIVFVANGANKIFQTVFTTNFDRNEAFIRFRQKAVSDGSWGEWVDMPIRDIIPEVEALVANKVNDLGDNAKFIDVVRSVNLFDKMAIARGILSSTAGHVSVGDSYIVSDFIEIEAETEYRFGYFAIRAFYDESKQFLSGVTTNVSETTTTPATAKYARVSFKVLEDTSAPMYNIDTYMLYKVAEAPSEYVEGGEKAFVGECPNHYANAIKKSATGVSLSIADMDANLQLLSLEVRPKNLLNPSLKLPLYINSTTQQVKSSANANANAFPVHPGETLYIGGDLSSFNFNSVRIGFTFEFPGVGMTLQNYSVKASGTSVVVPDGCYWAFWTRGQESMPGSIGEAWITRDSNMSSYVPYVNVHGLSVNVGGKSMEVDDYGIVKLMHRGQSLSVSSSSNVDFYLEYSRNIQDAIDEAGGADTSDIKFVGTGDSAYAIAGKDQNGADGIPSCIVFGYGNLRYAGAGKNIAFGKENLQYCTGIGNCAFGYHAIFRGTTATTNAAFGNETLDDNTSGSYNTGCGAYALQRNALGSYNTAVGYWALRGDVYAYEATSSWSYNVAVGWAALGKITTGGEHNVAVGNEAANKVANGKGNTAIGDSALKEAAGVNGCIAFGRFAGSNADGDYQLWIGSSNADSLTRNNIILYGEMNDSDMTQQFLRVNGQFELPHLPTSDPHIANRLWNDNGVLKISAGNV